MVIKFFTMMMFSLLATRVNAQELEMEDMGIEEVPAVAEEVQKVSEENKVVVDEDVSAVEGVEKSAQSTVPVDDTVKQEELFAELKKEEPVTENIETAPEVQKTKEVKVLDKEEKISEYVQLLNLTVDQQDKARYIVEDGRLKREQILRSLEKLRSQARSLEEKGLKEFESILTPEQREIFAKLKMENEKN